MASAQQSNYPNIQAAIAQLVTQYTGMPGELGDFSKITLASPNFVVAHGRLHSPTVDRKPQFEDLYWLIPVHIFADYQNDAEAHDLINLFRVKLLQGCMEHPRLDFATGSPFPPGLAGHALDSKLMRADLVGYFTLDERAYALSTYEIWVHERVAVTR